VCAWLARYDFMTYDLMYLQLRISCASHARKETVIISVRIR
jgi:hypothetical protein